MSGNSKVTEILVDEGPLETRVALLAGDRLVELLLGPGTTAASTTASTAASRVGEIVLARVTSVRRDIGTAFLDIGNGAAILRPIDGVAEGSAVLARITKDPDGNKGAEATRRIELSSPLATLLTAEAGVAVSRKITAKGSRERLRAAAETVLPDHLGVMIRTAASDADPKRAADAVETLVAEWRSITDAAGASTAPATIRPAPSPTDRARAIAPEAEHVVDRHGTRFADLDIDGQIAAALARRVPLAGGGVLTIEETEALVAIDVDGAGAETARGRVKTLNLAAADTIAAHLRLRALGGLVLIDFPRMGGAEDRRTVEAALASACAPDPAGVVIHGWTRGGLLELTRTRTGPSLATRLLDRRTPGPRVETMAAEALRRLARARGLPPSPRLVVAPEVAAFLAGDGKDAIDQVAERIGGVTFEGRVGYHRERIEIEDARDHG